MTQEASNPGIVLANWKQKILEKKTWDKHLNSVQRLSHFTVHTAVSWVLLIGESFHPICSSILAGFSLESYNSLPNTSSLLPSGFNSYSFLLIAKSFKLFLTFIATLMGVTRYTCAITYPYVFYKQGLTSFFHIALNWRPQEEAQISSHQGKEIFSLSLRTQVFRKFWIAKTVVLS